MIQPNIIEKNCIMSLLTPQYKYTILPQRSIITCLFVFKLATTTIMSNMFLIWRRKMHIIYLLNYVKQESMWRQKNSNI